MDDLKKSLGYQYLEETKFERDTLWRTVRPDIEPGQPYKRYTAAEKVTLPTDWQKEGNLQEALQRRRSCRRYQKNQISLKDFAMLLWAGQGITGRAGNYLFRTAPSAGGLYPVETYVAVENVESLDRGLYHFQPVEFCLERLSREAPGAKIAAAGLNQSFLAKAGAVFVWSAVLRRNFSKYGHRGLRYVMMDVGHICQNLLLAAEARGLGACPVAAFYDNEMNGLLGLDGTEESVIYLASVGSRD